MISSQGCRNTLGLWFTRAIGRLSLGAPPGLAVCLGLAVLIFRGARVLVVQQYDHEAITVTRIIGTLVVGICLFSAVMSRSSSGAEPVDAAAAWHRGDDAETDTLKRQLEEWGDATAHHSAPYEEGEEFELLLDPNLPDLDDLATQRAASQDSSHPAEAANLAAADEPENSPYPEVRASVRNYDEDLPCSTVRAWSIGLTLVILGASMNTLFSLRQPSIKLGSLVAQIIAWPIGRAWEKFMPQKQYSFLGIRWNLNPGPFNVKEHTVIVVMANVSFSVAYATDIILAQMVFYKQDFGMLFQLLLTVSTQSLGYGIAGTMRHFLGT